MEFHIGRVTGVPLEPRAALAQYDATSGRYTLYAGCGGAVRQKNELAQVLGIPPEHCACCPTTSAAISAPAIAFMSNSGWSLWAAKKVGRPVKYTATRSEAFLSDYQGRDLVTKMALALDKNGKFLALRADNISNIGARCVSFSPLSRAPG